MTKPMEAPRLEGWVTASEVAEALEVSRQTANQMINAGHFDSLHLIGPDSRPMYLIKTKELESLLNSRKFPKPPSGAKVAKP